MNSQQHPAATAGRRLISSATFKILMGGISEMTRWRHEKAGIGPMPVRRGGRNFYFQDEVDAYLGELAAGRSQTEGKSTATADNMEVRNGRNS